MISILALAAILMVSSTDAGVSYVRWGRTVCPGGNTRIYIGYMAGANYDIGGSGSNYLCLHDDPLFVRPVEGNQEWAARIHGVKLRLRDKYLTSNLFSVENVNDGDVSNTYMPCAVCYVPSATDQLMVPGRQDCGAVGYNLQYKGFVVAETNNGRPRGNYVCMDDAPEERIDGDDTALYSGVVYPVQMGCASLPCGPYVLDYELPCSVCTFRPTSPEE